MNPRVDGRKYPQAVKAFLALGEYLEHSSLDSGLRELISLRASQLNGCAYCIDMHTKNLRAAGASEQKLYLVSVWQESPLFSERERAALAWTEAVTTLEGRIPDALYEETRRQFSEAELVDLTAAAVAINSFNRLNVAFRTVAGDYQPRLRSAAA